MKIEISEAIEAKALVHFIYHDHYRKVLPFLLAKTKDSRLVLHGFQIGGSSSQGEISLTNPAWRYFYLDTIQSKVQRSTIDPKIWLIAGVEQTKPYSPPSFVSEVITLIKL